MAVQTQFNDNGYKNWLRACLSLQYLKEGVVDFVDAEVKQFHASIINNVCKYVRCNQCTTEQLTKRRRPQRCPNNICDRIRQEIENKHRFGPCWKNTDATKWCTDYWEIGKCFMSPGYTAVSKATATDCTGLLSVCINGKFLPRSLSGQITHPSLPGVTPDIFHKNRDARNALLHLASMSISDAERQDYIDDMIKLLANYKTPIDHMTQTAIDKLNELNSTNMVILPAVELSILQNKLEDVSISLTQAQGQAKEQKTDSEEHKQLIHNNSDSLVILSQRIGELQVNSKEDMAEIQDKWKSLHERNEYLKTQMSDLQNRLDEHEAQIENRLDDHESQIENRLVEHESQIENRLGDHEAQIENRLGDHEAHIENRIGDHAKAIEQQDIHINELRTDLTARTKGTERVRNIKDIQDFLVAKYKRDELSVPMSPLLRIYNVNVDKVYTQLVIRDDLVHNPKSKVENKSADRRYHKTSKSYQELLYDGETPCKNIYVIGKAGMGKTTWSRKLVATWIKAKEIRKRERKPNENVRILQDYDLVFYISLRHARADHHIMQMIEHQLFRDSTDLLAAAKTVLYEPKYSSRCIIILDGLDEWSSPDDDMSTDGLPVIDPTWQCSVITTTRSWKLEALQLQSNKIDRAVEIQGLEEYGIHKLTDRVVATLNKNSDKSKDASDFKSQVTPSVEACMQVPLLLTIFICLWHDDVSINEHLAGTYTKLIEMLIRCAEGDKRKRLFQKIPKKMLDEMKRNWSSEKFSYPDSLSGTKLFVSYLPFLLRLGKLAFDTLLSGSKEYTLVFDYESVEEFICEAELELSLKLGILSQTTERSSVCKETFSLSFLHKTMQEYLMALYMVCGDNKVETHDRFKAYCVNKKSVREMENVLLFTSGLCPETAGEISYHIAEMEPNMSIHRLLLRCWRESRSASSTSDHIYIKHHFLYATYVSDENYDEYTMCYLCQAAHKNSVMHIENLSKRYYQRSLVDLSACHSLKELEYKRSNVQIRVPPSLEEVVIENCNGCEGSVLDLSECKRLRHLEYRSSNVPIRVPPSLEYVIIDSYTGFTGSVLDLSGCKRLTHLECKLSDVPIRIPLSLETVVLEDYTRSDELMQDLSDCQSLRKRHRTGCSVPVVPRSVEELIIEKCSGSGWSVLDFSGCKRLTHLECRWTDVPIRIPLSLETVVLEDYTGSDELMQDLSECQSLRKLHCTQCPLPVVPCSLEELIIEKCPGSGQSVLDLSDCQSLRKLHYKRSYAPLRVPPSLEEVQIDEHFGVNLKYPEYVLDLSGCQSLRTLTYTSSSTPLQVPSNLEEVEIDGYSGPSESVLDLSGCQSLRTLIYTSSSVPLRIPARELDVLTTDHWTAGLITKVSVQ